MPATSGRRIVSQRERSGLAISHRTVIDGRHSREVVARQLHAPRQLWPGASRERKIFSFGMPTAEGRPRIGYPRSQGHRSLRQPKGFAAMLNVFVRRTTIIAGFALAVAAPMTAAEPAVA